MSLMNPKGDQQHRRNKQRRNNYRGGNNDKENAYNDKNNDNAIGNKKTKHKFKFHCKLCGGYQLTHLFPWIDEGSNFIA